MSFEYNWVLSGDRRTLVIFFGMRADVYQLEYSEPFWKEDASDKPTRRVIGRSEVETSEAGVLWAAGSAARTVALVDHGRFRVFDRESPEGRALGGGKPSLYKLALSPYGRHMAYVDINGDISTIDFNESDMPRQLVRECPSGLAISTVYEYLGFSRNNELCAVTTTGDKFMFTLDEEGFWRRVEDEREVQHCRYLNEIEKYSGTFYTEKPLSTEDVRGWKDGRIYGEDGPFDELSWKEGKPEAPYVVHTDSNGIKYGVHPPVIKSYGSDAREEEEPDYYIREIYHLSPKGKEERTEETHASPESKKAYNKIKKDMLKLSLPELDLLRLKIEAQIREERILIVRAHVARERITEKDIVEQMRGLEHYLRMRDVVSVDEALDDLEHDLGLSVD